jgi:hypothetical protein
MLYKCGVGLGVTYPAMIETLVATCHRHDTETLARCEVLAHLHMVFHPSICGLHRDVATVTAALIGCIDAGLLPGRTRGGGDRDRLLPLNRRMIMLDGCSNSSTALCI